MFICTCNFLQPCIGIKGLSALHILPSYDVVSGVVIDYMHCVLEGVNKKLLTVWFESGFRKPYYIKQQIDAVNQRLHLVKPPDIITRTPRGVDVFKKWKGVKHDT